MKKILLILSLSVSCMLSNAQYTLDHTFTDQTIYEVSYVELENSGKKLYTTNQDGETYELQFFNIDYTPYKNISIDLGSIFIVDYKEFSIYVYYISENLFDTDAEIEFMAELYYVEDTPEEYEYSQVLVFNETGSILFETDIERNNSWILWPSMNGTEVNGNSQPGSIHNTSDGTKMIIGLYDFVDTIYKYEIYDLPGTLPVHAKSGLTNPTGQTLLKAYPNPAKSTFTIDYKLVEDEEDAQLYIYTSDGKLIKKFDLTSNEGKIAVSAEDMPAGAYIYEMKSQRKGYTRRKLLISE
ncbi:MAG: T9SS type A sorting domain-containing protein [Bacteroidales bacterium]|nr:T9SS type A sorting domain-containing protein [Bacteroidales bacterium]